MFWRVKKKLKKNNEKRIKKVVQSHHKLFTNTNSSMETRDLNLTPALHSENYNLNNKTKKKKVLHNAYGLGSFEHVLIGI